MVDPTPILTPFPPVLGPRRGGDGVGVSKIIKIGVGTGWGSQKIGKTGWGSQEIRETGWDRGGLMQIAKMSPSFII